MQRTPGMNNTSSPPTATQSPLVMDFTGKTVTSIFMSDDQGHVFKAILDNQGTWYVELPSGCLLVADKISSTLSFLRGYTVMVNLETPPALADVGLTRPTYKMELIFDDGSIQTMSVGSIVPTGSGYYVQVNKDPVIVVSTYSIDSLFELVSTACATPTPEATLTFTPDPSLLQTVEPTLSPVP
ncbi:MAG: DUF4340 domain-containing protein [Anaerolineaceae bacterium]|nr:DUF4340 domain-containing protein [Anaerolineaceae bacterium]